MKDQQQGRIGASAGRQLNLDGRAVRAGGLPPVAIGSAGIGVEPQAADEHGRGGVVVFVMDAAPARPRSNAAFLPMFA
jgi:hypothetical protein